MAEAGTGFLEQLKSCIVWSWTYLWTLWFFIMLFLVYILRVPLKINDNLTTGTVRSSPRSLHPRGKGRSGCPRGRKPTERLECSVPLRARGVGAVRWFSPSPKGFPGVVEGSRGPPGFCVFSAARCLLGPVGFCQGWVE